MAYKPIKGNWKKNKVYDFGWAFQNPLIPVCMKGKKEGIFPTGSHSFCQLDQPNVLVLTLKQAEDKDGLIVRLVEMEGKNSKVTVKLPFILIKRAYQTNLVEENERLLSAQKHEVRVPVKAFGIATVRIKGS